MRWRQIGEVLHRRWWVILAPAVLSGALAGAWVAGQPTTYSSEGSFVVRVDVDDSAELVRATGALTDTDQVISTYVGVAKTNGIVRRAREQIGLKEGDRSSVRVTSSAVPNANILLIGARSQDPRLARDMARAAGELTQEYVRQDPDTLFLLTELDRAPLPQSPERRPTTLVIAGAALIALVLGGGLALAAEHRLPPGPKSRQLRNVVDERSTAYARHYFQMRLRQEESRSLHTDRSFSVGVLQVLRRRPLGAEAWEPAKLSEPELIAVTTGIRHTLRQQDVLGHLGQSRFAAILPGVRIDDARAFVQRWRQATGPALMNRRRGQDFAIRVVACEFERGCYAGDAEAERVVSEL